MPAPVLKSLADEAGKSLKDAERYWKDALESAKDRGFSENSERFYAYVTGIVKRRLGLASDITNIIKIAKFISAKKDFGKLADELIKIKRPQHVDEASSFMILHYRNEKDLTKVEDYIEKTSKFVGAEGNGFIYKRDDITIHIEAGSAFVDKGGTIKLF